MSEEKTPSASGSPVPRATPSGHREARAEALQRALRDNLRRRKAAATEAKGAPQPDDDSTRKNDG